MQELSLKQIIKIIAPKFKLVLLLVIIGAILGGCIGAADTYSERYFSTTIEFYVNPKRSDDATSNNSQFGVYGAYGQHVMDNIIKLLKSESFAEQMLLGDNGIPIDSIIDKIDNEEDRAALDEKIAEAMGPISEAETAKADLEASTEVLEDKKLVYDNAKSLASKTNSNYLSLLSTENASDEEREAARQLKEEAAIAETQAKYEYDAAEQDEQIKKRDYQSKQKAANVKIDAVLELWRETDVYKDYIRILTDSISYSYYKEGEVKTNGSTDTLAKSFIYVSIKVTKNGDIAKFVYERVGEVLPKYVQANMAVPSGYVGTNCVRVTRLDNIRETEASRVLTSAVKLSVLGALLAGIAASCGVVAVKLSKDWFISLRNELIEDAKARKAKEEEENSSKS